MRNSIREYIELNKQEKDILWNKAIFVFDTNVFLNLYRYSNNTRNQLIESLEWLKNRIWMPYQVALEFCKDRYKVIDESNKRFEKLEKEAANLINNWQTELRLDTNDSDIKELKTHLNKWITNKKERNFLFTNVTDDIIFEKILELFEGKVGTPFSNEDKSKIELAGQKRYTDKTPPGYKDDKKQKNKYGDLLIWTEILNHAKMQKVDIIYVTHDQKEDWWNISSGKTIGPRTELRKEFYEKTGQKFHMYSMTAFLSYFIENKGKNIDKTTIDEVELFSSVLRKKIARQELKNYYESLEDQHEIEAAKIRFKITNLERKNKKRENNIASLTKKAQKVDLTLDEVIALQHNQINLQEATEKIDKLKNRLEYLSQIE